MPTYQRKNFPREINLLNLFKQKANWLLDRAPLTEFDWLFWMRHYGGPTRLLDWSESPLVALYFATFEFKKTNNKDGALWLLDPLSLNESAQIPNKNDLPSVDGGQADERLLETYTVEEVADERKDVQQPIAVLAPRNNIRMHAQLGVFTINHRDKVAISDINGGKCLTKFIIPAAAKANIRRELEICKITRTQLFPEVASVATSIAEMAK